MLFFHNQRWLERLLSVVAEELEAGNQVYVLDIGQFATPEFGTLPRLLGKLSKALHPLEKVLDEWGAHYMTPTSLAQTDAMSRELEAEIKEGVLSHAYTLLKTDRPEELRFGRKVLREMQNKSNRSYAFVSDAIERNSLEKVYIPNYRLSSQKAAMLAARESGAELRFFENDGPNLDLYFNQDYPVHDRLACQNHAKSICLNVPPADILEVGSSWMTARNGARPDLNEFSEGWKDDAGKDLIQTLKASSKPILGVFTSSMEEYWSLGPQWRSGWKNQWDAFSAIINHPRFKDYEVVVRLHPNLGNKEKRHYRRELEAAIRLRNSRDSVHLVPNYEPVNSYMLVSSCDVVLVWNSTIGLESNLLGVPSISTCPSKYDLLVNVTSILGEDDVSKLDSAEFSSDPLGASKFIYYRRRRAKQIHARALSEKRLDWMMPLVKIPSSVILTRLTPSRILFVVDRWLNVRKQKNGRLSVKAKSLIG